MKHILTLILTLTLFSANAQWADTTAHERIDHINLQLHKAHKQYRTGTALIVTGVVLNGFALLMNSDQPSGFVTGLGSLFVLAGGVVHIDSHKYLGRTKLND